MGKKSKAKQRKEEPKIQEGKKKEVFLGKAKKLTDSKTKKIGAGLVLVGTLILITALVSIYGKMTPSSLSGFLPRENTIGFVELNIGNKTQLRNVFDLLKDHEQYKLENIKKFMYDNIGINFDKADFVSGKIGVGLLKSDDNKANIAVFIGINDKSGALRFLENLALKNKGDEFLCGEISGYEICHYTLSYNMQMAFIGEYLVISPSQKVISDLMAGGKKLSGEKKFIQIRNNLPAKNLVFVYVDAENLLSSLFKNDDFIARKGYELSALLPLLRILESHGAVLVAQDNNLAVQTYTHFNKTDISEPFIIFEKKYKGGLSNYIDENPLVFFGGANISKQLEKISQILSEGEETKKLLFEGMIRSEVAKYLGDTVSLEEDIYPIIKGEYAIAVEGGGGDQEYKFLFELSNPKKQEEKIKELAKKFMETNAVFAPKVIEVELEDGTRGKEIIATEEEIEETSGDYQNIKITSLKLGKKNWGIHYAFLDNIVVFTTTKKSLMRSIDLSKNTESSFKESYLYDALVAPIIKNCDEISLMNFDTIIGKFNIDMGKYGKYLAPFSVIVSGKNFFDDGIATTHYIITK